MALLVLGINHTTAPVTLRERVAIAPDRLSGALQALCAVPGVCEAVILSTCNRTELYCAIADDADDADDRVRAWLAGHHHLLPQQLDAHFYDYREQNAVRHTFRVAAGLDSLILGEPQILGQVKSAYQEATRAGTLGWTLSRLFQRTFTVAKQVRTDTSIGMHPVSVAFAAVNLARQMFGELEARTVLLLGAGATIELVVRHLAEQRIGRLIVANRTLERARNLAAPRHGYAIALDEVEAHLAEADIVIAAVQSTAPILQRRAVDHAIRMRKHRPMLLIDLAVPRNIDPAAGISPDVYLYTVDDLEQVIQDNLDSRRSAARAAEQLIDLQVTAFMEGLRAQQAVGTLRALRNQAEAVRDQVLVKAEQWLAQGRDPVDVVRFLAHTLTNKLLHAPSVRLRQAGAEGRAELLQAARELYALDAVPTDAPDVEEQSP